MEMYINGMGAVSPQDLALGIKVPAVVDQKMQAIDPDFAQWIDPRLLRRMSRIVSMGVTAAFISLKDAGVEIPDAITTGTGFGCLEDTGTFLIKLVNQNEEGVNPTPFIQSTHNTIGSQVALLLGCHGHNQTFTHQSFSLESAMLDARMLLAEHPEQNILVGAVDELTEVSHTLMHRAGIFGNSLPHGEGAFYFLCASKQQVKSAARIVDQKTSFKPASVQQLIATFLSDNEMDPVGVDLVLYGGTTNPWDQEANDSMALLFADEKVLHYKKYCGEFATSMGFAIWLSVLLFRDNQVLPIAGNGIVKTILIYNPYLGNHHSLILLKSCPDIK